MILKIALFEVHKKLRQISTYVYFAIFFVIALLTFLSAGGAFQQDGIVVSGSGGKVMINSPVVLFAIISLIHHFGVIVTAAIMGQSVYQDFHNRTFTMFFTAPITKLQYLTGRFLGSQLVLLFVFSSIGIGAFVASCAPFVDKELFGTNSLQGYIRPYLFSIMPNLFLTGSIFFGLAALTRRILPVYTGSVVLLIGYLMANSIADNLEQREMASLLDPFGAQAFAMVTQYWTPAEQNARHVPLDGALLWNRAIWISVGGLLWAFTAWRFKFNYGGERKGKRQDETPMAIGQGVAVPKTDYRDYRALRRLPGLTWLNFIETVKNIYFSVIVLAGVMFLIMASTVMSSLYGTETYPITALIVELTGGSFRLFILIIITFYSGEMVWRERDTDIQQLMDVLPIPDWLPMAAKILALIMIQIMLAAVIALVGMGIQISQGYFKFELGIYIQQLFVLDVFEYSLLCILAVTVQTLIGDKYLGHLVMIAYYLAITFAGQFGFEHNLYKFGRNPGLTYSDMNGYGHLLTSIYWFNFYWALWALGLVWVASLFWVRGTDAAWSSRWKLARQRYRPWHTAMAIGLLVAIPATGGWIYYNTCILNPFRTSKSQTQWAANYEKRYRDLVQVPQPRITVVRADFDIYPETRSLSSRGQMTIKNKTDAPIFKVYVETPRDIKYEALTLADQPAASFDSEFGLYTFELTQPLAPEATANLQFAFSYQPRGFTSSSDINSLVQYNGTFLNSGVLPSLGYNEGRELTSESDRRRYGLGDRERMPSINNLKARENHYISRDSDWVSLESTVSTSPDQIAIVPGYLQKEWTENNRRYFHYNTEFFLGIIGSLRSSSRQLAWQSLLWQIR
jgi:ABC-2 type transport system permease protein